VSARLLALVATLAVTLTACGGPDPEELVSGAAQALEDAGTASFEMRVVTAGQGDTDVVAAGAQDLTSGALRMDLDLGDEGHRTETLLFGTNVYLRSPLFELFTGDTATWVRVDLTDQAEDQGLDADALLDGNTGPAALLAQLDGAAGDPEELGREEVRGTDTTHLRVTIDTGAAIEQSSPETREQLRAYAEATGLPETYPLELWVDDDGLVRRIRSVLDVPAGPEGTGTGQDAGDDPSGLTQETTLELFDFGVSVDLDAPTEDETVDLAELIADLEALEAADTAG
jgi:hypothetical protein